jgi:hypothetical protein
MRLDFVILSEAKNLLSAGSTRRRARSPALHLDLVVQDMTFDESF